MNPTKSKEKDKDQEYLDSFLDYTNNYEACQKELEEKILSTVKENPNITVKAVYERLRLRQIRKGVTDSIRSTFTKTIGEMLGDSDPAKPRVKANGSKKDRNGSHHVQLIYVQGNLF